MAIKINDTPVEFTGYEYARIVGSKVIKIGSFNELTNTADGELFFRATYATPWIESCGV